MISRPHRVQLSRRAGWRLPTGTRSVARPHRWGNPWPVTDQRTPAQAVDLYRQWLAGDVDPPPGWPHDRDGLLAELHTLTGRHLACWCPPGQPCHAQVLLDLANPQDGP